MIPAGISLAGKIELKSIAEATKENSVILSMNVMDDGKNILTFKTAWGQFKYTLKDFGN
jgi:hypothetical protein